MKLLTAKQTAEVLQVSMDTVYRLLSTEIPAFKIRGGLRVAESDLLAYIASTRRGAAASPTVSPAVLTHLRLS